jgi:hypothetical protein
MKPSDTTRSSSYSTMCTSADTRSGLNQVENLENRFLLGAPLHRPVKSTSKSKSMSRHQKPSPRSEASPRPTQTEGTRQARTRAFPESNSPPSRPATRSIASSQKPPGRRTKYSEGTNWQLPSSNRAARLPPPRPRSLSQNKRCASNSSRQEISRPEQLPRADSNSDRHRSTADSTSIHHQFRADSTSIH